MCRTTFEFVETRGLKKFSPHSDESTRVKWICLELNKNCNFNCIYCYNNCDGRERKNFSTTHYHDLLERILRHGVEQISIVGGEPTVSPYFKPVLQMAAISGVQLNVCTNGFLINEKMADFLSECGIRQVQMNLDHASPAINDVIRGHDGAYESVLKALKVLDKNGIQTVIATVLLKQNLSHVTELAKIAFNEGADAYRIWRYIPLGRAAINGDTFAPTIEEYHGVLINVIENRRHLKIKRIITFEEALDIVDASEDVHCVGCPAGKYYLTIDDEGEVYYCAGIRKSVGNIFKTELNEILRSDHYLAIKKEQECLFQKTMTHCIIEARLANSFSSGSRR